MGHGNGYRMPDFDSMFTPTPHEAYVENCTEETVEKLMRAVKAQAMKDYINALAKLRADPHDNQALKTISEWIHQNCMFLNAMFARAQL
jgi:hypothetical protein